MIVTAGVGNKCLEASDDFICVDAFPQGKDYDINYGKAKELKSALKRIKEVPKPLKDPIFGKERFLKSIWK